MRLWAIKTLSLYYQREHGLSMELIEKSFSANGGAGNSANFAASELRQFLEPEESYEEYKPEVCKAYFHILGVVAMAIACVKSFTRDDVFGEGSQIPSYTVGYHLQVSFLISASLDVAELLPQNQELDQFIVRATNGLFIANPSGHNRTMFAGPLLSHEIPPNHCPR